MKYIIALAVVLMLASTTTWPYPGFSWRPDICDTYVNWYTYHPSYGFWSGAHWESGFQACDWGGTTYGWRIKW